MGKILSKSFSDEFNELKVMTAEYDEKNDCSVVAIARFVGCSYRVAHAALKANGRINGRGTDNEIIKKALIDLGKPVVSISVDGIVDAYPGRGIMLKNVTTHHPRRYPAVWKDAPNFLMVMRGHIASFHDGEVHDWSVNRALRVMYGFIDVNEKEEWYEFVSLRKSQRLG